MKDHALSNSAFLTANPEMLYIAYAQVKGLVWRITIPVFSSQARLMDHWPRMYESLTESCPSEEVNLGSIVWQSNALATEVQGVYVETIEA